ncbi:MAG: accessory factor UbiK family protein [Halioglobus sp.]|nr:accessory factor UbiK family protein [Halioglobus sp.]
MAIKPPPPPWDVLREVGELMGGPGARNEVDKSLRSLAQSALSRLDVVSREEFDAQTEVLRRTRERVAELETELEALASAVEAAGGNS